MDLLHSTGNPTQYTMIIRMGKNMKTLNMCICITRSGWCTLKKKHMANHPCSHRK